MKEQSTTVTLTDASFEAEVERQSGLVMVDVWAGWCGPCLMIKPAVEELAREYAGRVRVGTLDFDGNPNTPARFNIRSIPTLLFFRDGTLVDRVVGAFPKAALAQRLDQLLAGDAAGRVA